VIVRKACWHAQYSPDLFKPAAITQTLEDFRLLLEEVVQL
jgi:hypothetical protein